MTQKVPPESYRKGMSLPEMFAKFPNEEVGEKQFIRTRWKDGA